MAALAAVGFPVGMILATFDLQVAPIISIKFWFTWHVGSGERIYSIFSRWRPRRLSWISNRNNFCYFDMKSPRDVLSSSEHLAVRIRSSKYFQDDAHGGNLGFSIGTILTNFDLYITQILPTMFRDYWSFSSAEEVQNCCKMAVMATILDFKSERF